MTLPQLFQATLLGTAVLAGAAQAAGMQVSSSSFSDGGRIPAKYAGEAPACGGKGVSPQVAWDNVPAGTQSLAVVIVDPDGAKGSGVNHWVVYNLVPARSQLKEGEAQASAPGMTVGKNSAGAEVYRGMCPPAGDRPHHYVMTVIATDLPAGALPAALSREELMARLKGHTLGGQSVVGLYGV